MSVRVQDITVGRCYVTASEHFRRVLEITADRRVHWEDLGTARKSPSKDQIPTLERFAAEVEHEVSCDDPAIHWGKRQDCQ
jgi:hypothetical protein